MIAWQTTMACQACGAVLSRDGKYPKIPGASAPVPVGSHQSDILILFGAGKRQDTSLIPARCRSWWSNRLMIRLFKSAPRVRQSRGASRKDRKPAVLQRPLLIRGTIGRPRRAGWVIGSCHQSLPPSRRAVLLIPRKILCILRSKRRCEHSHILLAAISARPPTLP